MTVSGQPWNKNSRPRIAEPVAKEPIIHPHTRIWPIKKRPLDSPVNYSPHNSYTKEAP